MIFKCKMCGGDIEVVKGTNIAKCQYCKSTMTLPNLKNEKINNLYNRANDYRMANEFDKAYGVYETILEIDNSQVEAHWGILLCKYGVEYVDDPNTKEKIPTCHRTITTSILKDQEFKIIEKNSYGEALGIYKKEAQNIDLIQKNILEISSKESPYDIFICYKETDSDNNRTKDSVIAQDIYDKLIEKGFKVFFARITLENKLGSEYEPYIYSALNSAKLMLVVGTSEEYFNAVWVKNEWSRFLEMMKKDKKKVLIPVYSNVEPYKLPEEFAMFQAQSMDKIGAMQDLIRGIEKIISSNSTDSNNKEISDDMYNMLQGMIEKEEENRKDFITVYKCKSSIISRIIAIIFNALMIGSVGGILYYITRITKVSAIRELYIIWAFLLTIPFFMGEYSIHTRKKSKYIYYLNFLLIVLFSYICFKNMYRIRENIIYVKVLLPITLLSNMILILLGTKWKLESQNIQIANKDKNRYLEESKKEQEKFEKSKIKNNKKIIISIVLNILTSVIIVLVWLNIFNVERTNKRDDNKNQVIICKEYVNIRESPNIQSNYLGKVYDGEIYTILDEVDTVGTENYVKRYRNKWIKIKTGYGTIGYIYSGDDDDKYIKYIEKEE